MAAVSCGSTGFAQKVVPGRFFMVKMGPDFDTGRYILAGNRERGLLNDKTLWVSSLDTWPKILDTWIISFFLDKDQYVLLFSRTCTYEKPIKNAPMAPS
jgi:hypothetical protein